jgi:hypothetical protein
MKPVTTYHFVCLCPVYWVHGVTRCYAAPVRSVLQ